jgi:hypothetical protein
MGIPFAPMAESDDLIKFIAASVYFSAQMTAAREMFGKGFFSLSASEIAAVQAAVYNNVSLLAQGLTPEQLKQLTGQVARATAGFQTPSGANTGRQDPNSPSGSPTGD